MQCVPYRFILSSNVFAHKMIVHAVEVHVFFRGVFAIEPCS